MYDKTYITINDKNSKTYNFFIVNDGTDQKEYFWMKHQDCYDSEINLTLEINFLMKDREQNLTLFDCLLLLAKNNGDLLQYREQNLTLFDCLLLLAKNNGDLFQALKELALVERKEEKKKESIKLIDLFDNPIIEI